MPLDPYPSVKRSQPDAHLKLLWSKYRHTTGMVTECIAPNRQKIWYMMLGNPVYRAVKYAKYSLPFLAAIGAWKGIQTWANHAFYEDQKTHWD